jgi:hypothetical protein
MTAEISGEAIAHYTLQLPGTGMSEEEFFRFCAMNKNFGSSATARVKSLSWRHYIRKLVKGNRNLLDRYMSGIIKPALAKFFIRRRVYIAQRGYAQSGCCLDIKRAVCATIESGKDALCHICPDFVIALSSGSDTLSALQAKMKEWIGAGRRLAFLIDPCRKAGLHLPAGQRCRRSCRP